MLPANDPLTASHQVRLGICWIRSQRHRESEELLLGGYEVLDRALGTGHEDTQEALAALGEVYELLEEPAEAQKYRALLGKD